jgi:hypothetical protein
MCAVVWLEVLFWTAVAVVVVGSKLSVLVNTTHRRLAQVPWHSSFLD